MNQSWENGEKTNFGADFGTNLGVIFFCEFYLYLMLNIVASYHCMRFQGKVMNQTWENDKKRNFRVSFRSFGPSLDPKKFFRSCYLF